MAEQLGQSSEIERIGREAEIQRLQVQIDNEEYNVRSLEEYNAKILPMKAKLNRLEQQAKQASNYELDNDLDVQAELDLLQAGLDN
jgi:hypothetical protein